LALGRRQIDARGLEPARVAGSLAARLGGNDADPGGAALGIHVLGAIPGAGAASGRAWTGSFLLALVRAAGREERGHGEGGRGHERGHAPRPSLIYPRAAHGLVVPSRSSSRKTGNSCWLMKSWSRSWASRVQSLDTFCRLPASTTLTPWVRACCSSGLTRSARASWYRSRMSLSGNLASRRSSSRGMGISAILSAWKKRTSPMRTSAASDHTP